MIEIAISLDSVLLRLSTHGWSVTEHIKHFSHTFTAGKTYGVVGEFGDGAWSLAYLLSGLTLINAGLFPNSKSSITLNGDPVRPRHLKNISCFLKSGVVEEKRKLIFGERTVRQQIMRGLSRSKAGYSLQEIVERFQLSHERLDRPLSHYSGEGYRASLAIGFAYDKKVFACPWLEPDNLHHIGSVGFQQFFHTVKENGAMVIMPTNKIAWVEQFADELIYIEHPYADMLPPELAHISHKAAP